MTEDSNTQVSEFAKMKKTIITCVAGSALDWYDFAIYGFFATIIGRLFFPSGDEFQQMIASFGVLASGLIARPLGAIMFGYIGDRFGRKKSLIISIYLMAISTAVMGLLPTYEQVGAWSGISLTVIRILQGLALGGSFTGTMVFLYEHSSASRKATYSAWAPFSLVTGFILGAMVATIMSKIFDDAQLQSIGWRIPFILSFLGTFVAECVKHKLEDPKEFIEQQKKEEVKPPKEGLLRNLITNHWKGMLLIIFTDILTACGYFLIAIFFTAYFETVIKLGRETAFVIQTVNMTIFAGFILFAGWLSDRIGKRIQMIIACLSMVLLVYPLFNVIGNATFVSALLGQLGIIFLFSMYYGPIPATICSILPTKVRLMGVSLSHNLAMALFGAGTPALATYLIKWTNDPTVPALLFAVAAAVTAAGLFVWKEGKEY